MIPDDVMAAARVVFAGLSSDVSPDTQSDVEAIARALLAERERCAQIALQWDHRGDIAQAIRGEGN